MIHTLTIILNWNNPLDTILVANEVLRHHNSSVVIVDNNSSDSSLNEIQTTLKKDFLDVAWNKETEFAIVEKKNKPEIFLVSMHENFGFAKAINKVISKVSKGVFEYVWLLNNDAIPHTKALAALEKEMDGDKNLGFAGSVIVDFKERNKIQCCGVKYYPYLGISKLVLKNLNLNLLDAYKINNERIDFQHGASLLVRLSFIDQIGLMDERFFLYFEEQDWQIRAEKLGFSNKLVSSSIVYHKGSMSTEHSKHLFFFYYNTSAMIYCLKHNNLIQILSSFLCLVLITFKRTKMHTKSLAWGIKGIFNGIKKFHS